MLEISETTGHDGEKRGEKIPPKAWHLSSLQRTSCCLSKSSIRAAGCRSWSRAQWRDLLEHSPFTATCATALSDTESSRVRPSGHAAKVSVLWNRWCHFYSHWVVFSSLRGLTSQLNYTKVGPAVWLFQATLMGEGVFKQSSFSKMQSAQGHLSDYLMSRQTGEMWARCHAAGRDQNDTSLSKGVCCSSR